MSDIKNYKSKSRSISSSQILPCNYNFDDAKLVMNEMIQNGCYNMARQHVVTQMVHIFVGYGDARHDGAKGSARMTVTTNLFSIIGGYAEKIFDKVVDKNRPIRKIGYDFGGLVDDSFEQYDMFADLNEIDKEKKIVASVLDIQDKYGKNSILKATDFQENATQRERNNMIGGHSSGEE